MAFSFTRSGNYGVINDATGIVLYSPESATVYLGSGGTLLIVSFSSGALWEGDVTQIGTVNGITPSSVGEAISLISTLIFPAKILSINVPI